MAETKTIRRLKFWQTALASFLITQVVYGVEGWILWAVAMAAGWLFTLHQSRGEKNGLVPLGIWAVIMALAFAFDF